MLENEPTSDSSRYPGVFVTRKKKTAKFAETSTTLCIPFSFADDMSDYEWDKECAEKPRTESPSSELGSEQCLSSDTSCQARLHQLAKDAEMEESDSQKRPKRKKSKDRKPEINSAVDAIRYKTKMCKNWQLYEKCPYGPRCLFAHGAKELRTYAVNHSAITSAANSESPERQFYALGHFPSFIPVPFLGSSCSSTASSDDTASEDKAETSLVVQPTGEKSRTPTPKLPIEPPTAVAPEVTGAQLQATTHSPYTAPPSPPPSLTTPAATASVSPPSPVFSSLPTGFPYTSGILPPSSLGPSLCPCPPCPRVVCTEMTPQSILGVGMPVTQRPPPVMLPAPIVTCGTPPPILSIPPMASTPPSPTTPSPYGAMFGVPSPVMPCAQMPAPSSMLAACPMFLPSPAPCVALPCAMQFAAFPQQVTFPWQAPTPTWGVTLGMESKMYW